MKAMVLKEYNRPFEMIEVETPKAGNGEILLKVKACGICNTDLKIYRGEIPPPLVVLSQDMKLQGRLSLLGQGFQE
jgi:D-arabinose 1-dehydrogenase-like Zn-dependent alcohol dehydrogenase